MNISSVLLSAFVHLSSIDPSIQVNILYGTQTNFTGAALVGYETPKVLLTKKAALALKRAQDLFKKKGYSLVIYDTYRPQSTQDAFKAWSLNGDKNLRMKLWFYSELKKEELFEKGYILEKTSHSRGSTFDGTLIPLSQKPHPIRPEKRILKNGKEIIYLNDGTIDMGTSFNFFGNASWTDSRLISKKQQENRKLLKTVLESCGFSNYSLEWWHFTLKEEPFPDTYFNFSFDSFPPPPQT